MMRLWQLSYSRPIPMSSGWALSAVAHAVLIAASVIGTLPDPGVEPGSIENRVFYMPPPERSTGSFASRESIHFVALAPAGLGTGALPAGADAKRPSTADSSPMRGKDEISDGLALQSTLGTRGADSAFTFLEVDSAVVRAEDSAAPAYPLELLRKGVMGLVSARYVVDTTGFADTTSFEVVRATHPEFVDAVRAALPLMRFSPAKIGNIKVRQLVEQEFAFRIRIPTNP